MFFDCKSQHSGQLLKLPPDVKSYGTIKSSPAAYGVQLSLQHSLVLLDHIPQRDGHMLPVFTLCAVQTHGSLTWLAVKLHHLQRATSVNFFVIFCLFYTNHLWKSEVRENLVSGWLGFWPSPHGLGSRGASLLLQHWLTPERCRPLAANTLSLVEAPEEKQKRLEMKLEA